MVVAAKPSFLSASTPLQDDSLRCRRTRGDLACSQAPLAYYHNTCTFDFFDNCYWLPLLLTRIFQATCGQRASATATFKPHSSTTWCRRCARGRPLARRSQSSRLAACRPNSSSFRTSKKVRMPPLTSSPYSPPTTTPSTQGPRPTRPRMPKYAASWVTVCKKSRF